MAASSLPRMGHSRPTPRKRTGMNALPKPWVASQGSFLPLSRNMILPLPPPPPSPWQCPPCALEQEVCVEKALLDITGVPLVLRFCDGLRGNLPQGIFS